MNLIIIESPAKGKTIEKYLGKDYKVEASFGHIRDLPKSKLGIDVENNFEPQYLIPQKARKTVKALKEIVKKAESVILATDPDREGESIAWHLMSALELEKKNYKRIVFHEITKEAVQHALENPRDIDINLVNAQQARRILDRIVGYKLSPFLWKKVARRLSAGRVQSVAVKLIVEREREIEKFVAQEYWDIVATLLKLKTKNINHSVVPSDQEGNEKGKRNEFEAILSKKDGKSIDKLGIKSKEEADNILKDLESVEYKVLSVESKETKKNPLPPFTTSTLQQASWQKFKFPAKFTMGLAQGLYEAGHITYHRTDSFNIAESALISAESFIIKEYGKNYWQRKTYKTKKKGAQEAHEAIRPTNPVKSPEQLKLEPKQQKIYDLIWQRFVASQMSPAVFNALSIDIQAKNPAQYKTESSGYIFKSNGQTLKFDGFLKAYPIKFQETELPKLEINEILELLKLIPSQHFTQPPARYNEASLIKVLEENGIGRPSTYAPIISTIQDRNYVEKNEDKRFQPTEIGIIVNDILVKHFPQIVDTQFTAKMEEDLDKIASHGKEWQPIIKSFYEPFEENLKQKYEEVQKTDITKKVEGKICPECGSEVLIRFGKFGKFYACSAFPKCRYTESLQENTLGIKCPKCNKDVVAKKTKRKKIFYGCSTWPKCDFAAWDKPLADKKTGIIEKCPDCDSIMVEAKGAKFKKSSSSFQAKCSNKDCNYKIRDNS